MPRQQVPVILVTILVLVFCSTLHCKIPDQVLSLSPNWSTSNWTKPLKFYSSTTSLPVDPYSYDDGDLRNGRLLDRSWFYF